MPRYVKVKTIAESVKMEKPFHGVLWRPQYGDCVGVYEVTNEDVLGNALKNIWKGYSCFAIDKTEFETLLAFGIPLLNPYTKPSCMNPG